MVSEACEPDSVSLGEHILPGGEKLPYLDEARSKGLEPLGRECGGSVRPGDVVSGECFKNRRPEEARLIGHIFFLIKMNCEMPYVHASSLSVVAICGGGNDKKNARLRQRIALEKSRVKSLREALKSVSSKEKQYAQERVRSFYDAFAEWQGDAREGWKEAQEIVEEIKAIWRDDEDCASDCASDCTSDCASDCTDEGAKKE